MLFDDSNCIQNIIDEANIGRSTFYSHFETKDDLTKSMCYELFDHIITSAIDHQDHNNLYSCDNAPDSVVLHILYHLLENDNNILTLLSCEGNELFLHYFKLSLNELFKNQYPADHTNKDIPYDFLINHISGSFVEMVRWWLDGHKSVSPEELDKYFTSVIQPIL